MERFYSKEISRATLLSRSFSVLFFFNCVATRNTNPMAFNSIRPAIKSVPGESKSCAGKN